MNIKIVSSLVIAISLLGMSWAIARYVGPGMFITTAGPDHSGHIASLSVVSLMIDFGNGTKVWFNNTQVPTGDNFYDVTYRDVKGDLTAGWYGYPLQSHFVYMIMGYGCGLRDSTCNGYWSLWTWNTPGRCWRFSAVGIDLLTVSDMTQVGWYYTSNNSTPFPSCSQH